MILSEFNYISREQFFQWNPAFAGNCDGLWAQYWYCVASFAQESLPMPPTVTIAPSPVQTGIASNCASWYRMTGSDTCNSIAAMFGTFSSTDLINWNPAVWSDCSNIQVSCHIEPLCTETVADLQTFPGGLLILCRCPRHTNDTHGTHRLDHDATNDNHIDNVYLRRFGRCECALRSSVTMSSAKVKSFRETVNFQDIPPEAAMLIVDSADRLVWYRMHISCWWICSKSTSFFSWPLCKSLP